MSTQAQAPTLFEEESSNSQHDEPLRLIMQELQSLRDDMRDIRRDVTNLSNQQRGVSPHGSLNATTPRSNGPFNCSKTTEFLQLPHFDEELHPPPYGGRRGGFGGRGMPRHFEEVPRPQEALKNKIEGFVDQGEASKLFSICSISKDHLSKQLEGENWLSIGEGNPNADCFIMSTEGQLPTQSHQEGTSNPARMNLNDTLRSMQQSIEGLARQFQSVARDMEELKRARVVP
ncbi:hypothetical protein M9H77_07449 [Catharanthus roseus]|uniref:Uncharacterized protein n=1 Tax=Catharanthus roseus TaxID=4058 RepID=A0ACC0BV88_CATRO|nr:hypothetical protein M9H77_07449 [Catharanthus roseus]